MAYHPTCNYPVLWRKRQWGEKVSRSAAWAALACLVMAGGIVPEYQLFTFREDPTKVVTELGFVALAEGISVANSTPDINPFCPSPFYGLSSLSVGR